jgi:hypothetical protein
MEPTDELIDSIYAEKVQRARRNSPEQKFLAGGSLFDAVLERMKWGILLQNPSATEPEIQRELHRRLAIARRLEAHP